MHAMPVSLGLISVLEDNQRKNDVAEGWVVSSRSAVTVDIWIVS